jgi:hypothetical protein
MMGPSFVLEFKLLVGAALDPETHNLERWLVERV